MTVWQCPDSLLMCQ